MANSFKVPYDSAPEMIDALEAERIARENGGAALVNSGSGQARFFVVLPERFRELEASGRLGGGSPFVAKKETRKQRKMRAENRRREQEREARELKARRRRAQELHEAREKSKTARFSSYFT